MTVHPGKTGPIGESVPRARALRYLNGRGCYTDDISLPRMLHVAFLRSPHPHARIVSIDTAAALAMPGVVRVLTGADIAAHCKPYAGIHRLFAGMRAPDQLPLAVHRACWQGEPVAMVAAATRAEAEDAAEAITVDWEPLPAVTDAGEARQDCQVLHPELGSNIAYQGTIERGDLAKSLAEAAVVVESEFTFGRNTGVTLEPRAIIASYNPGDGTLTVHQSHQCPSQQQDIYARLLDILEHKVRVICPDVGGAFGLKQQLYGDEIAVCVASRILGRPVKFVADRIESFSSDIHAREHSVTARLLVAADGRFLALDIDDCFGVGAYSQYPRSSIGEGSHVLRMSGAAYALEAYRAQLTMVLQNKNMIGHYRSVGHPIAVAVTESLVDAAAAKLGMDAAEIRRRNFIPDDRYPYNSHGGFVFDHLSQHACLDKILDLMDWKALRADQEESRRRGVHRGLGLASFVELTGTGPEYYGKGEVRVSAQDGCLVKLEPSGKLRCIPSVTEQGQGVDTAIGQIVAGTIGVSLDDVAVISGDTESSPYGGGAWASRGAAIGGEAALRAARTLRENILGAGGACAANECGFARHPRWRRRRCRRRARPHAARRYRADRLFPPGPAAGRRAAGAERGPPLRSAWASLSGDQWHPRLLGGGGYRQRICPAAAPFRRARRRHRHQPDSGGRADPRWRRAGTGRQRCSRKSPTARKAACSPARSPIISSRCRRRCPISSSPM